MSKTALYSQC